MKTHTKIVIACFFGGALGLTVALLVTPALWYLGLLAGFVAGYLGYEFRQTVAAIPRAWRAAGNGVQSGWDAIEGAWKRMAHAIESWLSIKHPFIYPAAMIAAISIGYSLWKICPLNFQIRNNPDLIALCIMYAGIPPMACALFGMLSVCFSAVLVLLAQVGARFAEKSFFSHPLTIGTGRMARREYKKLRKEGYRYQSVTYASALRWMAKGLGIIIAFFSVIIWCCILLFLVKLLVRFVKASPIFIRRIHCHERFLCGIWSAVGVYAGWVWLAPDQSSLPGKIAAVAFSGVLASIIGVVEDRLFWKFVTRRARVVSTS
jgi:hypothetical protein